MLGIKGGARGTKTTVLLHIFASKILRANFPAQISLSKFAWANFLIHTVLVGEQISLSKYARANLLTQICSPTTSVLLRKFDRANLLNQIFIFKLTQTKDTALQQRAPVTRTLVARQECRWNPSDGGARTSLAFRKRLDLWCGRRMRMRDSVKRCEKRFIGTLPSAQAVIGPFLAHSGCCSNRLPFRFRQDGTLQCS